MGEKAHVDVGRQLKIGRSKNGGTLSIYSIINESRGPVNPTYDNESKHLNTGGLTARAIARSARSGLSATFFARLFVVGVTITGCAERFEHCRRRVGIIMLRFRYRILRHLR